MFIGHFAVGFAAKQVTPRISLAMLLFASLFADVLWPILVAAGVEVVAIEPGNTAFTPLNFIQYPYSHSLATLIAWGVVVGGGYRAVAGGRRTFATLALLVVSHWVLDYITHRADLPLYPGGPKFGLGLWNSVPGTVIVESAMFAAGVWMYARSTRARDAAGRWGWRALVAILAILYVVNLVSPPPPSVAAIWIVALVMSVVFVAWAWWVDHHRDHQLSRRT